ncbi:MAG TPA: hypothetical protein VGR47_16405 [Terracidiphilus sp.]|nr:hypothetical protein [Terracidiphilus sp.]
MTKRPSSRFPESAPLPAVITRREAVQGMLAVAAASLASGCRGSSSSSSSPTPPPSGNQQPTPSGSVADASLTVTASAVGTIPPAFAGLSYEKSKINQNPYLFTGANSNLIGIFKRLGSGILRIGGNSVDRNTWTTSGTGQTTGQISPADVDALAAFVQAAGWKCLYGINLGGAGPNPYTSGSLIATTTPALAADEIAYAYLKFGPSLMGFEIGNECDLYGRSYFSGAVWDPPTFESLWSSFRSAIVSRTPAVASLCTGPADAGHESSWTVPFGQSVTKSNLSLLTQHYYRANGADASSTAQLLISPDSNLISNLATLDSGANGIGVPFRMSECNSFYNGGANGVSDSYASSLWVIDFLFDCALGGSEGTNLHGGGNGAGYTPIADSGGAVQEARPEFYGMLLFTLAGTGMLYKTSLAAGSLNATAYAVKTASSLNLVVVNKESTQNLKLSAQLPQAAGSATLLEMTQGSSGASEPDLAATNGVTIQGASVGADGSFAPGAAYELNPRGTSLTCYVPALSAVLIQIT